MKKTLLLALALVLLLGLTACAENNTPEAVVSESLEPMAPIETEPATVEEIMTASETDAAARSVMAPPASGTDAALNADHYALAQEYVGRTVQELFDAIGEPSSSQYAASCAEENAEDGMLFYDGFYVWSLRTEADEIVHEVYLND